METQPAFVWADGRVKLHSVAAVDLYDAVVVHPGDAELDESFRLHNSVDHAGFHDIRTRCNNRLKGFENLFHGLQKFIFPCISFADRLIYILQIRRLERHS